MKNHFLFAVVVLIGLTWVGADYGQDLTSSNREPDIAPKLADIFDSETLAMFNRWDRSAETNGFILAMSPDSDLKKSLTRHIYIINVTTNMTMAYLSLPLQGCAEIELVDSKGILVEKTDWGRSFGFWSTKQMNKWLAVPLKWHSIRIFPAEYYYKDLLDLSTIFKLKETGEYSLHLKLCLVSIREDSWGNYVFSNMWLPEVSGVVSVHAEDISTTNINPSGTNF